MIKLSIIIPVYNCEKFIEKAIESLIDQKFRDVEIIIIDDGSTDNSLSVCRELEKKYNFVIVYSQENKGPGSARNYGIKIAKGEYITFLDSDDYIPKNTFKYVYKELSEKKSDIFVGNILCFDDVRTWHLPYMKKVFKNSNELRFGKINDLPELIQTPSVCNKWFKRDLIEKNNISFDTDINVGEDLLFTQKALLKSENILVKDIDVYGYRLVKKNSLIKKSDINFFKELLLLQKKLLKVYENSNFDKVYAIKRQLEFLVDSIFLKCEGLNEKEIEELINISIEIFNLDKEIVLEREDFRSIERFLLARILQVGDKKDSIKFINEIILSNPRKEMLIIGDKKYSYLVNLFKGYKDDLEIEPIIESKVENSYFDNENIIIKGYAFIRGLELEDSNNIKRMLVLKGKDNGNIVEKEIRNDYRTDLTYIYREDNLNYNFGGYKDIIININELPDDEYEVYMNLDINNKIYKAPLEYRLSEIKNKLKVKYLPNNKEVFARFDKSKYLSISIKKLSNKQLYKSKVMKLRRNINYDLNLLKNKKYKSFIVLNLYRTFGWYFKKKDIWLMGERPDTAQDNTYHLFKYIKEKNKNINAKYVITKDSDDLEGIKKYGDIVWFNSILHSLYLLTCKYTINSYLERSNMYTREYLDIIKYYPEYRHNKKIFLQHGVIGVSRVNHVLHKNKVDYDLFVVSSEFEKQHIIKEFGYKEDEVAVTGLARWDNLNNNAEKNKILLMPTWRSWIKSEEELKESEYFNRYLELINNKELHSILEKNNYELTFYPHYQTQKLIEKMEIKVPDCIKLVKQGEKKVQELINENYLLITDYSTVAFDFAYSNKPVIFYQFDYDEFYTKHYNEGPIDHRKDLFGVRVVGENKEIIKLLKSIEANKFNLANAKRYINVYTNHCEKVYMKIKENE